MKAKVLGIQKIDYVSKRTGEPVVGTTLHCEYSDAQVEGKAVSAIYLSDRLNLPDLPHVVLGSTVDIEYNSRGYVQGLTLVK